MTTLLTSELRSELAPESIDLQTILAAWNEATDRLQHTHEALQAEVRRLSDELEDKNRELARRNRLADLGQMASHVAHEVRNGLVPLKLYLSLLRRRIRDDAEGIEIVGNVDAGFRALEVIVSDLLHFSAHRDPKLQLLSPGALAHDLCQSLQPQFVAQGIEAIVEAPLDLTTTADPDMLRRALLNLILNAVDAMPQGGQLHVTARTTPLGIEIEVADNGPGLQDDALARLFEPFFTTKSTGTGLGLAIVERIAEAHGGQVLAANCPKGGAAFTFCLPHRPLTPSPTEEI
ncbi:Sensor protein ZraS [Anatilimnocola aggregata]|uniref:histidine kinase n=1 Tax=Anatilimnocola aggregata TaxID=2528021 RepID=A0A517Y9T1_9BACT|nr:ATP-binding protein [Anatilimnocola aggregata]QDU26978.1 Sensor protein ZraS [Anatilimnocola aggregata]